MVYVIKLLVDLWKVLCIFIIIEYFIFYYVNRRFLEIFVLMFVVCLIVELRIRMN